MGRNREVNFGWKRLINEDYVGRSYIVVLFKQEIIYIYTTII